VISFTPRTIDTFNYGTFNRPNITLISCHIGLDSYKTCKVAGQSVSLCIRPRELSSHFLKLAHVRNLQNWKRETRYLAMDRY